MKFTLQTLISAFLFSFLFTLWFLNTNIIYDYALFTVFALYNLTSCLTVLVNIVFRKKMQHYITPIFYILSVQFILFDVELANKKALDVIEQNKLAFKVCCHHKNPCSQLGDKWIANSMGNFVTIVQGLGANIRIIYSRYENYYDVTPDYLLAKSDYFSPSRSECIVQLPSSI